MMFTYSIKNCSVEEIVRLLTLFDPFSDRPFSFRDNKDLRFWPEKLASKANSIICSAEDDRVIGCMFFYDNDLAVKNREGFCVFFCVHPEFRRCGIASDIVSRVKSHLNKKGIPFFKLKCTKNNIAALKFYLKKGFCIIDDDGSTFTMLSKN